MIPRMGRPRASRKDLPPGLYYTPKRGYYFYRVRDKKPHYEGIGKVEREQAIRQWVKITGKPEVVAVDGTVAELGDWYVAEVLPAKLRAGDLKQATADEYRRQWPHVRKEFGARRYARTPAQSMDPDVLRRMHVEDYLARYRGQAGSTAANRNVALLSAVFSASQGRWCTFNPCTDVKRNPETPRNRPVTQADRDAIAANASPAYRLMLRMTEATGLRLTDVRELAIAQDRGDRLVTKSSKSQVEQEWEMTPALRAILDEAKTLPGRSRSLLMFPSPSGKPYSEQGVHYMRRKALEAAGLSGIQHRDIRKAAINEAEEAGMDAQATAGHKHRQTTERHYLTGPKRVKPIR